NEKTECKVEVEPSVEREGPFYFLFTDKDGEKYGRANKLSGLDKALAAGATEITKEEYFARKNGTYSGSQQNTGASDTTAQPGPVKVTADEVNKIMQAANISQPISCLLPLAENLLQGLATRMIRNGLRGSRPAIL
ncbi:exonuclease, partial [Escherichia coli]|nr:exonuclease [Escherichia coli]EEV7548314.1 exonuclease [Escherichia coli]EFI1578212.1 exonuclease [Escherichia coli]EFL4430763.1 exonuclease [Escherichia coli]EGZ7255158.1 exonuclease [Escherichia coli]